MGIGWNSISVRCLQGEVDFGLHSVAKAFAFAGENRDLPPSSSRCFPNVCGKKRFESLATFSNERIEYMKRKRAALPAAKDRSRFSFLIGVTFSMSFRRLALHFVRRLCNEPEHP